jgi:hypothetical protein
VLCVRTSHIRRSCDADGIRVEPIDLVEVAKVAKDVSYRCAFLSLSLSLSLVSYRCAFLSLSLSLFLPLVSYRCANC